WPVTRTSARAEAVSTHTAAAASWRSQPLVSRFLCAFRIGILEPSLPGWRLFLRVSGSPEFDVGAAGDGFARGDGARVLYKCIHHGYFIIPGSDEDDAIDPGQEPWADGDAVWRGILVD